MDLQEDSERRPAFFKVFYHRFSGSGLRIPYTKIAYPENVVLRDENGMHWNLKMKRDSEYWSFKDGWVEFKIDNQLKDGDLIIFEYIRESLFSFKIFDGSACEKTINDHLVFSFPKVKGKTNKVGSKKRNKNKDDSNKAAGEIVVYGAMEDNEIEDDGNKAADHLSDEEERASDDEEYKVVKKRLSPKEQLDSEIFDSGLAPRPANPYLVTKVKPKRRHELFIPAYLLKMKEVEFSEKMTLVDPHGRRYYAKRNSSWKKSSRTYYSGGWKVLCRKNIVSDEDYCIVEFVRGEDGNFQGHVSFVRVEAGAIIAVGGGGV